MTTNSSTVDPLASSTEEFSWIVAVISSCIWALTAVIGIPGNLFVILAILRSKSLETVSHILIFNLSLADLFYLMGIPILICNVIQAEWTFGNLMCKIFLSATGINQFASAMFLGVLSLDRYLAVCHPFTSRSIRTVKLTVVVSLGCWLFVILEMIPIFLFGTVVTDAFDVDKKICLIYWKIGGPIPEDGTDSLPLQTQNHTTFQFPKALPTIAASSTQNESTVTKDTISHESGHPDHEDELVDDLEGFYMSPEQMEFLETMQYSMKYFTVYVFALSYVLPLLCTWIFYARIIVTMWSRRQATSTHRKQSQASKVTLMGLAIVVVYTLSWIPYFVVQLSLSFHLAWTHNQALKISLSYFAACLQYMNSAFNPFLYAILTHSFKDIVHKAFNKHSRMRTRRSRKFSVSFPDLNAIDRQNGSSQFLKTNDVCAPNKDPLRNTTREETYPNLCCLIRKKPKQSRNVFKMKAKMINIYVESPSSDLLNGSVQVWRSSNGQRPHRRRSEGSTNRTGLNVEEEDPEKDNEGQEGQQDNKTTRQQEGQQEGQPREGHTGRRLSMAEVEKKGKGSPHLGFNLTHTVLISCQNCHSSALLETLL